MVRSERIIFLKYLLMVLSSNEIWWTQFLIFFIIQDWLKVLDRFIRLYFNFIVINLCLSYFYCNLF